jgi:glutamine synthetase
MAFVLAHLPGLCAFTMPQAVSYARVADNSWTSGSWVAWGTQNRETPLRRTAAVDGSTARWEVRCLDGMANPYLALYVILRAGLRGLADGTEMGLRDCQSKWPGTPWQHD